MLFIDEEDVTSLQKARNIDMTRDFNPQFPESLFDELFLSSSDGMDEMACNCLPVQNDSAVPHDVQLRFSLTRFSEVMNFDTFIV